MRSAWPVLIGLAVIAALFQALNPYFLTPRNLTNLGLQIAAMGTISAGLVLVMLLGEIDLSAGAVSGFCAAVMAVALPSLGALPSLALALAVGAAIGLAQGAWIVRSGVPSFVVTLAGLLGWQGAQLAVLGTTGSVNLSDPWITGLAGTFVGTGAGAAIGAAALMGIGASIWAKRRGRRAAGLPVGKLGAWPVAVAVAIVAAVAVLAGDRGVPLALLILLGVLAVLDAAVRRTRWGRHVLAVGGNAEAARRVGIPVARIRISVFGLASALAALGGLLAASRLLAVNQSSGGGDLLLNAIAAAVIGGTSLFGGRGSVWSALLGSLVIGAISNGMDLLALAAAVKLVVTGAVLLVAVTLDARWLSRSPV